MSLLNVQNLSVEYLAEGGRSLRAVDDVSLQLQRGQALGVVGESGCGKTTLVLSLLRLLPAQGRIVAGKVRFAGQDLLRISEAEMRGIRWHEAAIVFQGAMNALNPVRTIESQIIEVLRLHGVSSTRRAASERTAELLELVGVSPDLGRQYPHQFSGGMRQRALIAMSLACNPTLLIADEPTTALDVMVQAQILELLKTLQQELNLALILVTHDLGVVAESCDEVLVMYAGNVVEYATAATVFDEAQHPYTERLLHAFPDLTNLQADLASIPGSPPRLDDRPPGCCFEPRCNLREDVCAEQMPALVKCQPDHMVACHLVERTGS